jgi:hypothetical protein
MGHEGAHCDKVQDEAEDDDHRLLGDALRNDHRRDMEGVHNGRSGEPGCLDSECHYGGYQVGGRVSQGCGLFGLHRNRLLGVVVIDVGAETAIDNNRLFWARQLSFLLLMHGEVGKSFNIFCKLPGSW